MNRAFVITAVLMLGSFPAFSQNAPGGEGHDSSYSRKDHDLEDILRGIGDYGREGLPRRRRLLSAPRRRDRGRTLRPAGLHEIMRRFHSHPAGPGPIDATVRRCVRRRAGRHTRRAASIPMTVWTVWAGSAGEGPVTEME